MSITIYHKPATVQAGLEWVANSLEGAEKAIMSISNSIQDMGTDLSSVITDIEGLKTAATVTNTRLTELETKLPVSSVGSGAAIDVLANLRRDVDALRARIDGVENNFNNKINDLRTQITSDMDGRIGALKVQIQALEQTHVDHMAQIGAKIDAAIIAALSKMPIAAATAPAVAIDPAHLASFRPFINDILAGLNVNPMSVDRIAIRKNISDALSKNILLTDFVSKYDPQLMGRIIDTCLDEYLAQRQFVPPVYSGPSLYQQHYQKTPQYRPF